jgi:hypothetical protein
MEKNNFINKPFTIENIKDRNLIIQMLKFEDTVINSDLGKYIYSNDSGEDFSQLEAMLCIHRYVLNSFGFKKEEEDITNYRKIFNYYYKSINDYDKEIIESVNYMRDNKCFN